MMSKHIYKLTDLCLWLLLSAGSCQYEYEALPIKSDAVIDLTLPPYNCDNTGVEDCSDAIIKAFDDVLRPTLERQRFIEEVLAENPDTVIGFEILKERGVIFPDRLEPTKILYLPEGVYKVSKSIEYTFTDLKNTPGSEINRQIHFQGDGPDKTIIRLIDDAPGFQGEEHKPVINFMTGDWTNIAMSNTIKDLSIEVGKGNASAIGLNFMASNSGAVRDVTIRSIDPNGKGAIGLCINHAVYNGYVKNLTVEGFDTGIEMNDYGMFSVFEFINLKGQNEYGFVVNQNMCSIRQLESKNKVPALRIYGDGAHVVMIDSKMNGGGASQLAIVKENGVFFGRNLKANGYAGIYVSKHQLINKDIIDEFSSHGKQILFEHA